MADVTTNDKPDPKKDVKPAVDDTLQKGAGADDASHKALMDAYGQNASGLGGDQAKVKAYTDGVVSGLKDQGTFTDHALRFVKDNYSQLDSGVNDHKLSSADLSPGRGKNPLEQAFLAEVQGKYDELQKKGFFSGEKPGVLSAKDLDRALEGRSKERDEQQRAEADRARNEKTVAEIGANSQALFQSPDGDRSKTLFHTLSVMHGKADQTFDKKSLETYLKAAGTPESPNPSFKPDDIKAVRSMYDGWDGEAMKNMRGTREDNSSSERNNGQPQKIQLNDVNIDRLAGSGLYQAEGGGKVTSDDLFREYKQAAAAPVAEAPPQAPRKDAPPPPPPPAAEVDPRAGRETRRSRDEHAPRQDMPEHRRPPSQGYDDAYTPPGAPPRRQRDGRQDPRQGDTAPPPRPGERPTRPGREGQPPSPDAPVNPQDAPPRRRQPVDDGRHADRPVPPKEDLKPDTRQRTPEQQKAEDAFLAQYKANLDKQNVKLDSIQKGEGPYQVIDRLTKAGKLQLSQSEMIEEARRVRDRDFKEGNRDFYKVGEAPQRWSDKEVSNMMLDAQKKFRDAQDADAAKAKAEAEAAAMEKHVPSVDTITAAKTASGVDVGDPQQFRDKLKAHEQAERQAGTLSDADMAKPLPRVGGVFVASGAVTEAELKTALDAQAAAKAAKPNEAPPKIGDILADTFKGDAAKLAKIQGADKFYGALGKAVQDAETARAAAETPAGPDPYAGRQGETPAPEAAKPATTTPEVAPTPAVPTPEAAKPATTTPEVAPTPEAAKPATTTPEAAPTPEAAKPATPNTVEGARPGETAEQTVARLADEARKKAATQPPAPAKPTPAPTPVKDPAQELAPPG